MGVLHDGTKKEARTLWRLSLYFIFVLLLGMTAASKPVPLLDLIGLGRLLWVQPSSRQSTLLYPCNGEELLNRTVSGASRNCFHFFAVQVHSVLRLEKWLPEIAGVQFFRIFPSSGYPQERDATACCFIWNKWFNDRFHRDWASVVGIIQRWLLRSTFHPLRTVLRQFEVPSADTISESGTSNVQFQSLKTRLNVGLRSRDW